MGDRILLSYRRRHELNAEHKHVHDGELSVMYGGNHELTVLEGLSYEQLMVDASRAAAAHPELDVFIQRLELKPPVAVQLPQDMAKLLREDPIRYIRGTRFDVPTAVVEPQRSANVPIVPRPLRAGVDTLADAFGEEVYVRVRLPGEGTFEAECPECGRWAGFAMQAATGMFLIFCRKCCVKASVAKMLPVDRLEPFPTAQISPRWAVLKTTTLLGRASARFYLPREWNTSGAWISHDDLEKKYEQYTQERAACSASKPPDSAPSA